MGSFLTSATGTGNSFAAAAPDLTGQDFTGKLKGAEGDYGQVFGNENNLAQTLQAQASGAGLTPDQLQAQSMNENAIKSNTGMIASQKGINPALAARLASQNAAGMQQQAAGQNAMQGMQRQLSTQQALAGLYGNQANQSLGQQSTLQNALAAYNNAQVGATSNMNNVNAGVAAQNASTAGGMVGGVMSGLSGIASMLAEGGEVPTKDEMLYKENAKTKMIPPAQRFDMGGPVMSNWGYNDQPAVDNNAVSALTSKYISAGGQALDKGLSSFGPLFGMLGGKGGGEQNGQQMAGGAGDAMDRAGGVSPGAEMGGDGGALALLAANGGEIPDHIHHMARLYHPDFGGKLKELKAKGGSVPGQAKVQGNSYKNDTVPTMLSPGEIVLPRSVTQSENPVKAAADFVAEKLREKQEKGSGNHSSDFHDALKKAIGSRRSK